MKLTKSQIRKIIKEELENAETERVAPADAGLPTEDEANEMYEQLSAMYYRIVNDFPGLLKRVDPNWTMEGKKDMHFFLARALNLLGGLRGRHM